MKLGKLKALVATDRRRVSIVATVASLVVMSIAVSSPQAAGVFAPTITLETSTTRATAHPDARITIDNTASDENIKDLTLSLPDGFWGSLSAVPFHCEASDAEAGNCGTSAPETKIGTVTATANIVDPDTGTTVDGVLSGDIFMVGNLTSDSDPANDGDPAGISIVVDAKVGGVDLGRVVISGRAVARMELPTGFAVDGAKDLKGLDTIVKDVPQEITDEDDRTVSYKVNKLQVDLISELQDPSAPDETWGYMPPLLTNPSRCDDYAISATATPYGGGDDVTFTDDYEVDGCDTVRYDPQVTSSFTDDPIPAGSEQGLITDLNFPAPSNQPASSSSTKKITVNLPRGMGAKLSSFGNQSLDMCPGSSMASVSDPGNPNFGRGYFRLVSCPPSALVGVATITTPVLQQPITGNIYAINQNPVPGLVIQATEDIPGNPAGINLYLLGSPDTYKTDPSCTGSCDTRVSVTFDNLPDTPISAVNVNLNQDPRPNHDFSQMLSGRLISQADNLTANCQAKNDLTMNLAGASGTSRSSIETFDTTCTGAQITPTDGPWGEETTDATPTFDFTYSGAVSELYCGIDSIAAVTRTACKTPLSFTAPTVPEGSHRMIVGDGTAPSYFGSKTIVRDFAVQPELTYDEVVPTTSLSAGPGTPGPGVGTTADSTPSFTFNASETGAFQCSLDGGAFLPCGSASGTASDSYEIPTDEYLEASDVVHTFEVRAQDTAGNVDLTPAKASFKVEKQFDPQNSVSLSTNVARAHPELTMTITNDSHEDIKNLNLELPDGFFGGLTGVSALCPIANADAGTCAAGSQVGTVEATALIERSTASIKGKVFLTDPRTLGDPAGLTIEVAPKLQDVEFQPIRINARLMVRGEAQGINTAAIDIPNITTSTLGEESEFDVRTLVIKLKNNSAAPQPLLTNPSACFTGPFKTTLGGYLSSNSSDNPAVTFTGCENLSFGPALGLTQVERSTGGPPAPSTNVRRAAVDLTANLNADPNGAGIKKVSLTMPVPVTIDTQLLPPACSEAQAAAKACPATSAIGSASAVSPLLATPLTGSVYVLKSSTSLPRLLIALRGVINVDLTATNSYTGASFDKILTTLDALPDVPLTSFNMVIKGFLTTRPDSCEYGPEDWNVLGTLSGHNGAASAVNIPFTYDCPNATNSIFQQSWKPKKAKSTLGLKIAPAGSRTLKKTTITLPKGVKFIKSAVTKKKIAKKITVTAGGKKLNAKCFKVKSSTTFEVGLCKKTASNVFITFKSGSLTTKSKSKKLKAKVKTVDSANKKQTAKMVKVWPF